MASTANYLHKWKWHAGAALGLRSVGAEAVSTTCTAAQTFTEWEKLGVRRADGKPFPASGQGILFFPSGAEGPAFIVTENFDVLKEYNNSDAYAIAVGHLADRIHGGGLIKTAWPKDDRPLSRDARVALQKKLIGPRLQGE